MESKVVCQHATKHRADGNAEITNWKKQMVKGLEMAMDRSLVRRKVDVIWTYWLGKS